MKKLLGVLLVSPIVFDGGCGVFHSEEFPAKASRKETSMFSIARGGVVELGTFNGAIRVRRFEGPGVRIERTTTCRARSDEEAAAGLDRIVPEVLTGADLLRLKVSDPGSARHRFVVDLDAEVPPAVDLVLKSSNGEISVTGVEGDIDAQTRNGAVTAREGGRRRVHLESRNGEVVAERLAGSIEARTSNGRVLVCGCPGKVDVSSSNGGLEIDSSQDGREDITARTGLGAVRCVLPGSFSGDLEAETSLGEVRCDFPIALHSASSGKRSLKGSIGTGGPRVKLRSGNGSIEVLRGSAAAPAPPAAAESPAPPSSPGAGGSRGD